MAAHEQPFLWAPQANKMNDWGTCLRKSKMEKLFPDGARPCFKGGTRKGSPGEAAHACLGFPLWRSDFITLAKKQYILICSRHHWLAPICQLLNLGGGVAHKKDIGSKASDVLRDISPENWFASGSDPHPAATCDSLCARQTVYWWQKIKSPGALPNGTYIQKVY